MRPFRFRGRCCVRGNEGIASVFVRPPYSLILVSAFKGFKLATTRDAGESVQFRMIILAVFGLAWWMVGASVVTGPLAA